MDWLQILLLAITQGLTEFLPISSSAHLILAPKLFGFPDQGLIFDIAIHFGSLFAVIFYLRQQLWQITGDFFQSLSPQGQATENSQLGWMIIIATIPIVLIGLLLKVVMSVDFRSAMIIAGASIGFGLLLWFADSHATRQKNEYSIAWKEALIIGFAQALAIIPGTSRSGITITAGLMLGLTRRAAARFSFLLSIPTILMSGGLVFLDILKEETPMNYGDLLSGIVLSFIAALLCIYLFMRYIEKMGMLPFVIYRVLLGILILYVLV